MTQTCEENIDVFFCFENRVLMDIIDYTLKYTSDSRMLIQSLACLQNMVRYSKLETLDEIMTHSNDTKGKVENSEIAKLLKNGPPEIMELVINKIRPMANLEVLAQSFNVIRYLLDRDSPDRMYRDHIVEIGGLDKLEDAMSWNIENGVLDLLDLIRERHFSDLLNDEADFAPDMQTNQDMTF